MNADVWLDTSDNSVLQYPPATSYLLKIAQENNIKIEKYDDASGILLNVDLQSYVVYESEIPFEEKPFKVKLLTHEKEFQEKVTHDQSYDLYFDLYGLILIFSEEPYLEIRSILTRILSKSEKDD